MICNQVNCLIGEVGSGVTNPIDGILDEKRVILKVFNNEESNRVLINELVCYQIADKLKLPIPRYGIANINNNTDVGKVKLGSNQYGKCFYTERINNVTQLVDNKKLINKYITEQISYLLSSYFTNFNFI